MSGVAAPPAATVQERTFVPGGAAPVSSWTIRARVPFLTLALLGAALAVAVPLRRATRASDQRPAAISAPADLARFLSWGAVVELEENDRVINVTPHVSADPRGGFLLADRRESQVRRYRADGRLAAVIGRKGSGPGEFRNLVSVRRLPDGRMVAAEMGGRLSIFAPDGRLNETQQAPVAPIYDIEVLDGRRLLLAGRRVGTGGTGLIHTWDLAARALTRSFMAVPGHDPDVAGAYAFAGTADAVARGDTIAAVFALSDSIYLFDPLGRDLGRIAIPFQRFRPLTRPMPGSGSTLQAFREWGESFSAISQLYWLRDGSFLVQYYDMRGVEPQWRLLHVDRAGQRRFEGVDTPKLLAADGPGDELTFVHPGAEAPNVWVSARLRP